MGLLKVENYSLSTSLVVQLLRLDASTAGAVGSLPGCGIKILHTEEYGQINFFLIIVSIHYLVIYIFCYFLGIFRNNLEEYQAIRADYFIFYGKHNSLCGLLYYLLTSEGHCQR